MTSHESERDFGVITLFVLCCTIVKRAIREHRGYAAEILFGLVAHHKSILCRPLLVEFRTYPFL
jgi:hypothetical protein